MDANAGNHKPSFVGSDADHDKPHVIAGGQCPAGCSCPEEHAGNCNALRIDIRLAEETGRKLGPAVLVTGGIGRHDGRRSPCVAATPPCASDEQPQDLLAATNTATGSKTDHGLGIVRCAEVAAAGTPHSGKKLSTLAEALAKRSNNNGDCSTPLSSGGSTMSRQSCTNVTPAQQTHVDLSGSGSTPGSASNNFNLGRQQKNIMIAEDGVALSSPCGGGGEDTGLLPGGIKTRRSSNLNNENNHGALLPVAHSRPDVIMGSGTGASFSFRGNAGKKIMNQALAVARKRSQQFKTKIKESADGGDGDGGDAHTARKSNEALLWKNDGQACFLDRCLHSSAARGARHTMKLVHDLLREVTATAAVAAAVPPASLCIETDSEEQRRTAGGPRNMQSRERLLYERRVRYEQGRFIAEASVPVHIAASARAHYNRLGGWAHHAFREAHAKYVSERDLYNSIEGRWEAANQALQAASQAVAAPTADLTQSFQLYICAQQYLQAGEEFVKSAEAEDKVANGELARATEDLVVAGRALVRAEMTLCDFNRSYFSRGRDQGESFVSVPSVQSNPRHNLIEEEEDQEMQEYVEVSRNNASPNNAALPLDSAKMALVGTKSWSALHAPDDPPPVGQQSRAAATADDDDFEKLAQALLEGSSDQDTDETLSDCSNVDREKHKQGSPEEHEHGGRVRKMSPAAIQETALDREKYLERLTHTLKGARQNVRDAIARKNRAQIEVDRTLLLIGARTAGGWSLAAERCQTAAKAHRRARKGAGPVLKTAVERARMFRYLERLRSSTRHKLNQAWRARESARARAEPRTTALFAAAAATAAAAAASPNAHREARRIGAFYADDVTRTTTAGEMPQQVVPAEPMEEEGCPDDRALRRV